MGAVACGQRFTIIATHPCEDEILDTAVELQAKTLQEMEVKKPNQIPDDEERSKSKDEEEAGVLLIQDQVAGALAAAASGDMMAGAMAAGESKSEGVESKYAEANESKHNDEQLMDSILSET